MAVFFAVIDGKMKNDLHVYEYERSQNLINFVPGKSAVPFSTISLVAF